MVIEREKAVLMTALLEKFAPYMDKSTAQFQQMGNLITNFGTLVESLSDMPDDKKREFMKFIHLFNEYIGTASTNYTELGGFYAYLADTTSHILLDYKKAMGLD